MKSFREFILEGQSREDAEKKRLAKDNPDEWRVRNTGNNNWTTKRKASIQGQGERRSSNLKALNKKELEDHAKRNLYPNPSKTANKALSKEREVKRQQRTDAQTKSRETGQQHDVDHVQAQPNRKRESLRSRFQRVHPGDAASNRRVIPQSDNLRKNSKDTGGKKTTRSGAIRAAFQRVNANEMKTYKNFLEEPVSFRAHDKLNPTFWNGERLKPEVRKHLLKVANAWASYVDVKKSDIVDVLLLGGNAGYNYTKYSDLDLHLVVDTKVCPDVMSDYYQTKKQLWVNTHDVKVYGHDVEPYVEEPGKTRRKSQGVFSLKANKWLVKPEKLSTEIDTDLLSSKVRDMISKIDRAIKYADNEASLESLLKKLRDMRNSALDKGGEFAFENLVFKELRNKGYIDKLADHILKLQDKSLTLENYVC